MRNAGSVRFADTIVDRLCIFASDRALRARALLADVRGALGPYLNVFLVWADGMMSARTDAVGGEQADVKAWSQPSTA